MIEFFLRKRRVILFIFLPSIFFGFFAMRYLPVKLYPNVRKPRINVNIPHSGFTAEDFFKNYGDLIEERLNAIKDVDLVESEYGNNGSVIRVEFDWKISSEEAKQRVLAEMNSIKSSLPEEAENFSVGYWRGITGFLSIAVTSEKLSSKELYERLESVFSAKFAEVEDAETIDINDVDNLTAEIILKPIALLNYGLKADDVANAIRNGYKNISVGYFNYQKNQFNVRVKRYIDNIFSIEKIVVDVVGNKVIYLKDIADINIRRVLPRRVYRSNGIRSVLIFATPKEEGNIKKMAEDIKKIIKKSKNELPDDVKFDFIIDPAEFINNAIRNVVFSGSQGAILAILIILLLLGEVKNTLIIAFSIPSSVILSFILMYLFGVSLNLISLGGMALAVGMIVDASIVVIENIHRHRIEAIKEKKRINFVDLIIKSVEEIFSAVVASTLTTICVFFPISFTSPLTNAILGDIAKSVIFTLTCSMFIALIVIPVVAFYLFRKDHKEKKDTKITYFQQFSLNLTTRITNLYISALRKLLYSKKLSVFFILISIFLLFFSIFAIFPRIKKEIIAQPISNRISIRFTHFASKDKEEMMNNIDPIEKELSFFYRKKLVNVYTTLHRDNAGTIILTFKNSIGILKTLDELKKKYSSSAEWRFDINLWDPSSLPLPRTYDLHIKVFGPDKKKLITLLEEIVDLISKEKIYVSVSSEPTTKEQDDIILIPRLEVISQFSDYNLNKLINITSIALGGKKVITMKEGPKELNIYVKYDGNLINSLEKLENYLFSFSGKAIPLKHFFYIKKEKSIPEIRCDNGEETYNIFANMARTEPMYKRVLYEERIKKLLKEKLLLPEGYSIQFQDTQKIINESVSSLLLALFISVILIYIVLGIQFNSIRIPLIILVTIPFGFIGVIFSLYIFRSTVSLNSLLGTILLGGIVVNNAIIIIDFFLKEKVKKEEKTDAILKVARLRFLPIIITTTTTIFGMIPIALGIGNGANVLQPLGISVAGGLGVSTFFTLFMVPCIMNLVDIVPQHYKEES